MADDARTYAKRLLEETRRIQENVQTPGILAQKALLENQLSANADDRTIAAVTANLEQELMTAGYDATVRAAHAPPREQPQSIPPRHNGRVKKTFIVIGRGVGRIFRGYSMKSDAHHRLMLSLGKADAWIYALMVAIMIPIMGYLRLELFFDMTIAIVWLFVTSILYWWIELGEITAQIKLFGLLDTDRTEQQRRSMMLPYWGATIAVVLWIISWASDGRWMSLRYDFIEWMLIVHTVLMAMFSINVIYPLVSNYLQATSMQRRVEREQH
jgi:hypothetical protein